MQYQCKILEKTPVSFFRKAALNAGLRCKSLTENNSSAVCEIWKRYSRNILRVLEQLLLVYLRRIASSFYLSWNV